MRSVHQSQELRGAGNVVLGRPGQSWSGLDLPPGVLDLALGSCLMAKLAVWLLPTLAHKLVRRRWLHDSQQGTPVYILQRKINQMGLGIDAHRVRVWHEEVAFLD